MGLGDVTFCFVGLMVGLKVNSARLGNDGRFFQSWYMNV